MIILKRASAVAIGLVLGAVLVLTTSTFAFKDLTNDERAEKFGVIMQIIIDETINEEGAADPDNLYNIALEAVFEELGDKHGAYWKQETTVAAQEDMAPTNYAGIGSSITEYKRGDFIGAMLLSPFEEGPAAKAGLKTGDVITHVLVGNEWKAYEEGKLNETVKLLKGEENTEVTVKVVNSENKNHGVVTMTRAITKMQNIWVHVLPSGVLYVRLVQFNEGTDVSLRTRMYPKIKELKKQKRFKGIILDLRDNPGGRLFVAIRVADLFIKKGKEIITVKSRKAPDKLYKAKKKPVVSEKTPMVVLIDGSSASASELVTGALVQQEVAISMGEKSFGKGSVQTIVPINDGSSVKVTTARYYPAGGLNVDGVGIEPTIEVKSEFEFRDESLSDEERRDEYLEYFKVRTSADPGKDFQLHMAVEYILDKTR